MKKYYRVAAGLKGVHANECFNGNYIGASAEINIDLSEKLPEDWREFNKEFVPYYISLYPEKTKIAAGLTCGSLHTISKHIQIGDVILCPDGSGNYYVGEVTSNYFFIPDTILPHRRQVNWYNQKLLKADMIQSLSNQTGIAVNISKYALEIEELLGNERNIDLDSFYESTVFSLEKHLEEFLMENWDQTELGKKYEIYKEEGQIIGQQYRTDTGPVDILAISKDQKELLVVELKRGKASDNVVGQIQRYMGFVKEVLAEKDQIVKGVIIALEDDLKLKRALSVTNNIEFYKYQVNFKLLKN